MVTYFEGYGSGFVKVIAPHSPGDKTKQLLETSGEPVVLSRFRPCPF